MSKIYLYIKLRGGEEHGPPYIFCLLFKKIEKVQEHDLYLNKILHYFDFFFVGIIKKI